MDDPVGGPLLGRLRGLLEQLLPPDEPREHDDDDEPPPEPAASDSNSASSSSDSDAGDSDAGTPRRMLPVRPARMPALAHASSSESETDDDAPGLASASSSDDDDDAPGLASASSSSDDEVEAPPRRARGVEGLRVVRVGRHVLVVGGGPAEGDLPEADRAARVRTALALIRHVMIASRGSESHEEMADALARDGAARAPHVVAAFRAVDRARFLPEDARADAYIDSPARSSIYHQSSPSIYAAALEALDLGGARRLSFLNVGSGTGYFSALCDAAAAAAGSELAPHIGLEREAELAAWARARTADVYYDVGDVYDVVASLRDARSPLRGRFDRVYIGAGVDRAACRVLLRLLAPGGLLVAPRDDRRGEAQRLVTVVRRGAGEAYAIAAGARVAFASLVAAPGGSASARAPALAGPIWGEARPGAFPPAFRAAVAALARGVEQGGTAAATVPWHVWRAKVLPFVPAHWSARGGGAGACACAKCGLPANARCFCGAVVFCSRNCQRAGFEAHAAVCTARPAVGLDAADRSDGDELDGADDGEDDGAEPGDEPDVVRRLRAASRAAETVVAGEEARPATDADARAEARARRARYHSWWWDDDGADNDEGS